MGRLMQHVGSGKGGRVPALTGGEVLREVCLPFVGLVGVCAVVWAGSWAGAGLASGVFFALCIRLAHDLHHRALKLPVRVNAGLLFVLSGMILSSMHAARRAHLAHHGDPMGEDDLEGAPGRLGFWRALLLGAVAVPRLHAKGLRDARGAERGVIIGEMVLAGCAMGVWVWAAMSGWPAAWGFIGGMVSAHVFSPMVAVWAVHRGSRPGAPVSRTQRARWFHVVTLGLLYHLEHHRYPGVPTCRLHLVAGEMGGRKQEILPGLGRGLGPGRGTGHFRGYFRGLEA